MVKISELSAGSTAAAGDVPQVQSGVTVRNPLGTMGYQSAAAVAITGGVITGITPLAVADGGTGAGTAPDARTNLGLVIGTDVQAFDAELSALAGISSNGMLARTGSGTAAARTITGTSGQVDVSNGDGVAGNPTLSLPAAARSSVIQFVTGDGSSVITTGVKGWLEIPFACTITAWRVFADQSGDIVWDIARATYANLPTFGSIDASAPPTLSGAQKNEDVTLTGWTTSLAAGDWIEFEVVSAATVTRCTVSLTVTKA
jgi:hypothetical protein